MPFSSFSNNITKLKKKKHIIAAKHRKQWPNLKIYCYANIHTKRSCKIESTETKSKHFFLQQKYTAITKLNTRSQYSITLPSNI